MRLPLSSRQLVRVTPEDGGPTYLLAVPTVWGANELNFELIKSGILMVSQEEVYERMEALLPTVVTGRDYDTAVNILYQLKTTPDQVSDQDKGFLTSIERRLVRENPDYALLMADRNRWWPAYQFLALHLFLRGIESPTGTQTWEGNAPDDVLAEIPRAHLDVLSQELVDMLTLGTETRKNLPLGSALRSTPENLPVDATPQMVQAGK